MPTLLAKTKWVKNANIAFYFNAKKGNNISNSLTNGSCFNCRMQTGILAGVSLSIGH